jgi:hypothetical protein
MSGRIQYVVFSNCSVSYNGLKSVSRFMTRVWRSNGFQYHLCLSLALSIKLSLFLYDIFLGHNWVISFQLYFILVTCKFIPHQYYTALIILSGQACPRNLTEGDGRCRKDTRKKIKHA